MYSIGYWRQARLTYFVYLGVTVNLFVMGYFFEVLSSSFDGALTGTKIMYLGSSFLGVYFYLFSRDYRGLPRLAAWKRALLLAPAVFFSLEVIAYPLVQLHYTTAVYVSDSFLPYLDPVVPGPMYYPSFAFTLVFVGIAAVSLLRHFFKERRYEGAVLFLIAVILPTITLVAYLLHLTPRSWNPLPFTLTISICLLFMFLLRYRQLEWQSTGRELVVQNMRDGFILIDNNASLIDYNLTAQDYFPSLGHSYKGINLAEIKDFPLESLETQGHHQFDLEVAGKLLNLRVSTTPIKNNGDRTGTCILIIDDTENHRMMQELTRLARRDDLTGLCNRATFYHDASLSFGLCRREKQPSGCALMMDIDHFKRINDTYGHAAGDEVLSYIGSMISKRFRSTDILGRYGGEELCVWMPLTRIEGARHAAEEVRTSIAAHVFTTRKKEFSVTISIGISSLETLDAQDCVGFEDLMKMADLALYAAKNSGRNRVCEYHQGLDEE
jgi:diguanylate cyclase (GGDEF)-like protein